MKTSRSASSLTFLITNYVTISALIDGKDTLLIGHFTTD